MSDHDYKSFGQNSPDIARYAEEIFKPQDTILSKIRSVTAAAGMPDIHVGKMDGLHLEVLTRAFKVKKAVEIGTLAGYSAVNICRGLLPGGKLYTFEFAPKHAELSRKNLKEAGFDDQVEIFVGAAMDNLNKISHLGPFDLVFIDADKNNYSNYFKWASENLAVGGVILADNTFGFGMIAQKNIENSHDKKQVESLNQYNRLAASHPDFRSTVLPTGEGLTLSVKIR